MIDHIPVAGNVGLALVKLHNGEARLWIFAGTRANRCIARNMVTGNEMKRIDALGWDASRPFDLARLTNACTVGDFATLKLEELSKAIKFVDCLPHRLVMQIVRERQFDEMDFSK